MSDNTSQSLSQRHWWITILNTESFKDRFHLYEQSLKLLPGSYKLWYNYLSEIRAYVSSNQSLSHYTTANTLHERCLTYLYKMPQIWLDYTDFLSSQGYITKTRHVFDLALQRLPITQHDLIWDSYLVWVMKIHCPETTRRVIKRYLQLNPGYLHEYIQFLIANDYIPEAVEKLQELLNTDESPENWKKLAELLSKHPDCVQNSAEILKACQDRIEDQGEAWSLVAEFYLRLGDFDEARKTYEAALRTVDSVKDFSLIFAAYTELEEQMLKVFMDDEELAEQAVSRLEQLLARREELLSDVRLRENPNDVYEWLSRVNIYKNDVEKQLRTYAKAVTLVDPFKAKGSPQVLWVNFARLYEENGHLTNARVVFHKATLSTMKKSEQLAEIWEEWIEMEIRHRHYNDALNLARTVCLKQHKGYKDKTPQAEVSTTVRLWSLYIDLEESLGTVDSTRMAYEKMISNKFATVQTVLSFAQYLKEKDLWDDAFRVYENGINKFNWPHCYDIWVCYLHDFIEKFGKTKLERMRDLFEQVLLVCPKEKIRLFYLMYARIEEQFGLGNHVIEIFEKAVRDVPAGQKPELFLMFMQKVSDFYGIVKMRNLFEQGFELFTETQHIIDLGLHFVIIEKKLGEIERARSIFTYISQYCDARKPEHQKFWIKWNEFEVYNGTQDTFREMMRIKRMSMFNAAGVNLAEIEEPDDDVEEGAVLTDKEID